MGTDGRGYRHWRLETGEDRLAWLTFDRAESSANTLSSEVMEELERILEGLAPGAVRGLVIRSGKANGFIAGADIAEFGSLRGATEALAHIERGQGILARLERLGIPTVAMVHGFCLGGGLELALACRYRVASDAPDTKLGLPEVNLGIHPGFGGTVRLTALLGPVAALELMLSGRSVAAKGALKLGLVDAVVPERHLARAARALLLRSKAPRRPGLLRRLPGWGPLRPLLGWFLRRQVAQRVSRDAYPAPYALIDLWVATGGDPQAMYRAEARSVAQLITGATAQNLVRVFRLQERLKGLARKGAPVARFVHVVGGGVMGGDIAAWCALQGLQVTVQDVDPARLAKVVRRAAALFQKKLRQPRQVQEALDRLTPDLTGAGAARADVVIEAIFEDCAAKQALYRDLEPRMKADAILASNTSSIPLEMLAEGLARPERFVGLHFFNPVAKMQLVEVVTMAASAADAVDRATALVGAIRRLPLPVKSGPGFLVNRILMPYLMEAVTLEGEGVSPVEIDRAAVAFGMPMGPVRLADTVGLDICLSVARILGAHSGTAVPERLEALVAAGRLGRKSGRGFYEYREGKPVLPRPSSLPPDGIATQRLMLRLVNEAVACLGEGVTLDADLLDAGVIFGTGFAPFRGGPLRYTRQEGAQELEKQLLDLAQRCGARFRPGPGWPLLEG